MTAAGQPRSAIVALCGAGLMLGLAWLLKEELNPDWLGYALLYQDTGAWLEEQGRDPLFLWLINAGSAWFGPDGYFEFRVAIAGYFAVFTALLLRGRLVPVGESSHGALLLFVGLLPFVAPRFTIQIREGLALTLVFFGIALLGRGASGRQGGDRAWLAVLLFVAGAAMHSGTAILLVALLAGLFISRLCARSIRLELLLWLSLAVIAVAVAAVVATFGPQTRAGAEMIDAVYGVVANEDSTLSWAKALYWAAYGVGLLSVAGRVFGLYRDDRLPLRLRAFIGPLAIVLLPAIYTAAILLLAGGQPAIVVSGAARIMNMLLSVTLVVLALQGALNAGLGLFAVLVLVDQARIIAEAVLGALGGSL